LKAQATYRSNLAYHETYESLKGCPKLQSIDDKVGAGIVAWFKDSHPFNIRISPRAKVIVTYASHEELEEALDLLKEYGVPRYGSRVSLTLEGRNPPYDEMRYIYNLYERGHLWHPPVCTACMMEAWSLTFQLQNIFSTNFNPIADISEWMRNLRCEWMQGFQAYMYGQLLAPIVGFNMGWEVPTPRFRFLYEPPEDLKEAVKRGEIGFFSIRGFGRRKRLDI